MPNQARYLIPSAQPSSASIRLPLHRQWWYAAEAPNVLFRQCQILLTPFAHRFNLNTDLLNVDNDAQTQVKQSPAQPPKYGLLTCLAVL